jgi:saccharopine dehydrogenase-like NADP-dependent oxidoreductase
VKIFCLGGGGRISREAVLDLVRFGSFERITVGESSDDAARDTLALCGRPSHLDHVKVDVRDADATVAAMRGYDVVMDGTTISLNDASTRCIALAGCHGINLNGFGDEYRHDALFRERSRVHVPGFGMTPGVTNMMAVHAAGELDTIDTVRVSHGAFRPIAFSRSIAETTTYEYDPGLPGRVVFEDGEFVQVEPFARPLDVTLPEPYGTHPQYIIPHSETRTLAEFLADKGVRTIEVRGTWPPRNMRLIRALYEYGILANPKVTLGGSTFGLLDAIAEYLCSSPAGTTTDLNGYALHVELTGTRDGKPMRHVLTHTHPRSDGSVPEWAGLRAYTRCVGIPLAVGVHLIAAGRFSGVGVCIPERVFTPADVFRELERREIRVHHERFSG